MSNIEEIAENLCCSCGACYNICPVGAISMKQNDEGFYKPVIDKEKCTNCGLCVKTCPTLNTEYKNSPNPDIYAVMGDHSLRMKSSSGGMFSLLSEYILDKGGYVCGAAYNDDWSVSHIIVDNKEELAKLRKSKYMQSDTGDIYKQVKTLLDADKYVLFSGCPCQIAGLNAYLKKSYDKLLTVDLVCHGVPSPAVFQKFLKENYSDSEVVNIDFREKEVLGWTTPTVIKYKNGEVYRKAFNECSYFRGFIANMFLNKHCGDCNFNKIPRQGDITLGDFWQIRQYNENFTDGKGTGLVLVNNEKGRKFVDYVKSGLKLFEKVPMDFALKSNPNLNCSFQHHPNRDLFFKYLKDHSYEEAFKYAIGEKYDIGLMGLGWADNYGAALTNFGLVKTLEKLGKRVLVIDRPKEYHTKKDLNVTRKFNAKHFNISAQYDKNTVILLNEKCDTFMVGSDQVWHWNVLKAFREYFLLEFVLDSKKKIAYASSFGHYKLDAPLSFKYIFSYLLSRFDAISVREISGVNICKELGVKATHVLDPVFLCDREKYIELAESAEPKREKNSYIFSFILDPHRGDKKSVLTRASEYSRLPLLNVTDYHETEKREQWLGLPTEKDLEIEEFISNLYNSKFVITDSFHGVCFAIIFKKNFICIANKGRGIARFESLLNRLNLQDRILYNPEDFAGRENLLEQEIDYNSVYNILEKEKETSFKFLIDALNSTKNSKSCSSFDAYNMRNIHLRKEIVNQQIQIEEQKNNLYHILNSTKIRKKYYRYKLMSKILLGKKRKHYKEKARIFHEKVREIRRLEKEACQTISI